MEPIRQITRRWVRDVVIGHQLCPFARKPFDLDRIRYQVSPASTEEALVRDFVAEVALLESVAADEIETTLLIHPEVLQNFDAYLMVVAQLEEWLRQTGLEGTYQLASFHPDYIFAGSEPDDPANYTNRSPFPMLHILREAELEKALESYPDPGQIPIRNEAHLRAMGLETVQKLWHAIKNSN